MTTAVAGSKILEEIAIASGQELPDDASKVPSYMRQVRKLMSADSWNSLSENAQEYMTQVTKAIAAKKQVPYPSDFGGKQTVQTPTKVAKNTLAALKQKARETAEEVKKEKEKKKAEKAALRKDLKAKSKVSDKEEADVEEEIEELEEIPNDMHCVNDYKTYNVAALLELYKKGRIKLPKFQRKECWKPKARQEFLEDFMSTCPVHSLMLVKAPAGSKDKELYLLDGFQRMTAFAMFAVDVAKIHGRNFSNMSKALQDQFLLTDIPIVEVTTEKINWRWIFCKTNKSGMPLNDTEIRRAMYEELDLMTALETFCEKDEVWRSLFSDNQSYKALGSILRAIAMHYCYKEYKKPVARFLDVFCNQAEKLCSDGTINVPELQVDLTMVMKALDGVVDDAQNKKRLVFRMTDKSQINLGLVDCMIHAGLNLVQNNPNMTVSEMTEKLRSVKQALLADSNTYTALTSNTSKDEYVYARLNKVDSLTLS